MAAPEAPVRYVGIVKAKYEEIYEGITSEAVFENSSMYDALLSTLHSRNQSMPNKKRRRQDHVNSHPKEDEVNEMGSLSISAEDDKSSGGSGDESPSSHVVGSKLQEPSVKSTNDKEYDISENEWGASDVGDEHNFGPNSNASSCSSSFHVHMGYELSEEDVENLTKKKWKYVWEVPAFDMPHCKWVGTRDCCIKDVHVDSGYGLKKKLLDHWLDVYKTSGGSNFHLSKQRHFFSLCDTYRDIQHCKKKPFYLKGQEEDMSIMDAYIMHILNHILRTRDLVSRNDTKIAKYEEFAKDGLLSDEAFLDRGFTRPKVLILLPFKSIALRLVDRLVKLTPQSYKVNIEHYERFRGEFETQDGEENKDGVEFSHKGKSSKPSDFEALFGRNCEDLFMIGIKFTRKSMKLYNDFYSSDMIVASPVGVLNKIEEAQTNKEKDVDYLSSIEVLVIDHADVIAMQNWDYLAKVLDQLNRLPTRQHGADIMRIRKWYLDGHARFYRQSIILGHHVNPDINASFSQQCVNYRGKVKLACEYKGILSKVLPQVQQVYERFNAKSVEDADTARLEHFIQKVFPKIKYSDQGGIMLFVGSYFEYVRLRKFLKSQNASVCLFGDFAEARDISRVRTWFFEGQRKIMLYTERAYFYHRYKIRGVKNLIIYSLPQRSEFYPEVVNMLGDSENMTCTVLFSQLDMLRLERIVGTAYAKRMITSEKNVFTFC